MKIKRKTSDIRTGPADSLACGNIPRRLDNRSSVVGARVMRFVTTTTIAMVSYYWVKVVRASSMAINHWSFYGLKFGSLSLHLQVLSFAGQLLSLFGDFLPFKVKHLQLLVLQLLTLLSDALLFALNLYTFVFDAVKLFTFAILLKTIKSAALMNWWTHWHNRTTSIKTTKCR